MHARTHARTHTHTHTHTKNIKRAVLYANVRTAMTRISLRIAQSNKGLCCPLTDSMDATECMNDKQKPE